MTVMAKQKIVREVRKHLGGEIRVGVDLVEIDPFRSRFESQDGLLPEVFTSAEISYSCAQRRPWLHLAARFAAKEATFKAIGCGLAGEMSWRDVEVDRDEAGTPILRLFGDTARRAGVDGLSRFAVSLSHGKQNAIAVVVAVKT